MPGILKYGLLREDSSFKASNPVITGEEGTRREGVRRNFVSFTDQLSESVRYSNLPHTEGSDLLSFGIVIGISSDDIGELDTFKVDSTVPELGIVDKLPKSKIKLYLHQKIKLKFFLKC